MKSFNTLGKRATRIVATLAFVAAVTTPVMAQAASPTAKSGQSCTKAQLNRKSGTLTCTYNTKTKKYTWTAAAAPAKSTAKQTGRASW